MLNTLDQVLTLKPDRIALFGYAHVPWMKSHQKLIDEAALPGAGSGWSRARSPPSGWRGAMSGRHRPFRPAGQFHGHRPSARRCTAISRATPPTSPRLLGFGASAISRLPQGLVQNQPAELVWRAAVAEGRLAIARGVALTDEDRLRGEVIERLMCDFAVDLDAVAARHHRRTGELADAVSGLAPLEADGVVERHGQVVRITELGRPFVRTACAQFDAYLDAAALRHSRVV